MELGSFEEILCLAHHVYYELGAYNIGIRFYLSYLKFAVKVRITHGGQIFKICNDPDQLI